MLMKMVLKYHQTLKTLDGDSSLLPISFDFIFINKKKFLLYKIKYLVKDDHTIFGNSSVQAAWQAAVAYDLHIYLYHLYYYY